MPSDTYRDTIKAGEDVFRGEVYEYPFRVTDFHGEVIRDDLDTIPPLLNQEEVDTLVSHVLDGLVYDTAVADAVKKLPDSEGGRGDVAPGLDFGCQKCKERISPSDDELQVAFGHFYHRRCVDAD